MTINTAIPTIFLCFFVANASYYILLPWDVVSTSDSIAVVCLNKLIISYPELADTDQTAISRLLGVKFGILAAILICLVVAGSILGNSLVVGRMTVAAANKGWFPKLFTVIGRVGLEQSRDAEAEEEEEEDDDEEEGRRLKGDAPVNALILSVIFSALYILFGNFRALLTFNGLGEYTFFFLTVLGAIALRFREPGLHRPYKPLIIIPIIFAVVSGFVIVRGAVFAPVQALILIALWVIGIGFYWVKTKWLASS